MAKEAVIRIIQVEWSSEMQEKYSKTIQFYEENKILKVRSRLGEDTEDFHAGVQTTLSHLRERFWIPLGRRIVREVLHKCLTCKRYSSKPLVPDGSAPLPVDRINRVASFEVTGADLACPIYLKGGQKAWIVIFMCAVYRDIHLELVTSMSTEAFMQALRGFFARRGRSSIMYTDNGTNFVGTSRALNTLNWPEIVAKCAIQKIKWNFSIPHPHHDIVDARHLRERIRVTFKTYIFNYVNEYLAKLIRNPQLSLKRHNLSPGDIVLIGSDNTKRLNWPLGRVIELFKGKDNIERVVRLRVANGQIIRPIQRIYPLEIDSAEFAKSVPENVESATETIDDIDHEPIPPEEQSETLRIEQSQSVKKTRFGRRIVPVKRLDL
ncbi:integrase catalytic domain-containing protein [Trichonephila clavipes]|nr:integrase catalytic domain-containing protein [Trichonephila clavipes]